MAAVVGAIERVSEAVGEISSGQQRTAGGLADRSGGQPTGSDHSSKTRRWWKRAPPLQSLEAQAKQPRPFGPSSWTVMRTGSLTLRTTACHCRGALTTARTARRDTIAFRQAGRHDAQASVAVSAACVGGAILGISQRALHPPRRLLHQVALNTCNGRQITVCPWATTKPLRLDRSFVRWRSLPS